MKKEQKRKILFYGILAGALLLFAACAAHLAPYDPYEQNLELSLLPPSAAHWMGTDRYGRDLFSRILSGARVSIFSALLVVAASALIGTLAGIFSGWLEGKTDTVLMQISDIFLAFPGMVFAIAFSGVLQSGMTGAVVSLILVSWPKYARLARNRVLALKHMPFIAAARLTGNGTWKMIGRHILPNLAGQTIVTAVLDDAGNRGSVLPRPWCGSAVGGVGSDDEQRKKYAADRALGHSGAGTGDFSDRSCLQSAW